MRSEAQMSQGGVRTGVFLLVGILLAGASACEPRRQHRIITLIADGVPPYEEWMDPPPRPARFRRGPRKKPRLPPPPEVNVRVELPAGSIGFPATWEELVEAMPQDPEGDIDWAKALADGLIAPQNTIPPAPPEEQEEFEDEIVRLEDDPDMRVVFPHLAHTKWLTCDNCHLSAFEMMAGETPMSMDEVDEGKGCGVCHRAVAFSEGTCERCHPGMAE